MAVRYVCDDCGTQLPSSTSKCDCRPSYKNTGNHPADAVGNGLDAVGNIFELVVMFFRAPLWAKVVVIVIMFIGWQWASSWYKSHHENATTYQETRK